MFVVFMPIHKQRNQKNLLFLRNKIFILNEIHMLQAPNSAIRPHVPLFKRKLLKSYVLRRHNLCFDPFWTLHPLYVNVSVPHIVRY